VQSLFLDRLPAECLSTLILYPGKQELHAMLRASGQESHRVFDLGALYPNFQARDLTPVPGKPAEFAIWGADEQGSFRVLRFGIGSNSLDELSDMLLADIQHPIRSAPRVACAYPELIDQAWFISSDSGDLFQYRFSEDTIELVKGEKRRRDFLRANYLEVDWSWPAVVGMPFMIQARRTRASEYDYHSGSRASFDQVSIWMEADGASVRSIQGGVMPR